MADNKEKTEVAASKTSEIADVVKAVVTELIPAMVAVQKSATPTAVPLSAKQQAEVERLQREARPKCPVCRQPHMACNDKHVKMVVRPQHNDEWFQGVFINGEKYYSVNSGHAIDVPASNDIAKHLQLWETNERELQTGRKFTGLTTKKNHGQMISGER